MWGRYSCRAASMPSRVVSLVAFRIGIPPCLPDLTSLPCRPASTTPRMRRVKREDCLSIYFISPMLWCMSTVQIILHRTTRTSNACAQAAEDCPPDPVPSSPLLQGPRGSDPRKCMVKAQLKKRLVVSARPRRAGENWGRSRCRCRRRRRRLLVTRHRRRRKLHCRR